MRARVYSQRVVAVVATVIVAFLVALTSGVHAQEQSLGDQAYAECRSREYDSIAATDLVHSGIITEAELSPAELINGSQGIWNEDVVQRLKKAHRDEFEQLAQKYEQYQDWQFRLIRGVGSVICNFKKPLDTSVKAAQSFWNDPIGKFVQALLEGNAQTLQVMMTFWLDFSSTAGTDVPGNTEGVKNIVLAVSGLALTASFIVGGLRLAASRRSGFQDGLEDMGGVIARWLIYSLAFPIMVPPALVASDRLSEEIMKNYGATSPDAFVDLAALNINGTSLGPIVMLVLTLVTLAGSVMQLLALIIRAILLPVATGLTPLFAALSFTEQGRTGLNHLTAWIIAAVVFKPISAIFYAVVLWNATRSNPSENLADAIISALMIGIAGFTAPSLVRSLVPTLEHAGGQGANSAINAARGATGVARGLTASAVGMGARVMGAVKGSGGSAKASPGGGSSVGGGVQGSPAIRHGGSGKSSGSGGSPSTHSAPSGAGGPKRSSSGGRPSPRPSGSAPRNARRISKNNSFGSRNRQDPMLRQSRQRTGESIGVSRGYSGQVRR